MNRLLGSLALLCATIVLCGCSSRCCPSNCPSEPLGPPTVSGPGEPLGPPTVSGPSEPLGPPTVGGPSTENTSFDITKIQVGPDNSISWKDAKAIIQFANIRTVYQTHARAVYITLQDGTKYSTVSPGMDDVIRWIETVGKREQIAIMLQ